MLPPVTSFDPLVCPLPLRRHQTEALEAWDRARTSRSRRWWITMPPGAGKTLVGTEVVRRLGRRAVVFSPNTAIQHQWVATWNSYDGPHAGTHRDLRTPVTSLTYQSLAVFDDESGPVDGQLGRLHPNGAALVETLREAGPVTIVLDECHHLMEVWGELLHEVLESLPEAVVLGLTATPPGAMTRAETELAAALFGPVLYEARIPSLVVEGTLAPYSELAWLTTPTAEEAEWLAARATRFRELTTDLFDPEFGSTPFPQWLQQRFADPSEREGGWGDLATREPELTDAALRLVTAELMTLPAGAQVREQHRRELTPDDWRLLLDDWVRGCVRPSAEKGADADDRVLEALRLTLPSIDFTLTGQGIRAGNATVDRVTARSAAKQQAVAAILAAEQRNLGDAARALVLCDHEQAAATSRARLSDDDPPPHPAGSATGVLVALLADPACAGLEPMMVTGRTVAGSVSTLETLVVFIEQTHPGLAGSLRVDETGPVPTLTGRWTSGQWVGHVTRFLTAGGTRALVGTRGLLGEGWDAPCLTTLVDLTTATTPTAVVQTRGRALRTDPESPDKVALIWSVVCVFEGHSAGANDWDRFARKHRGYFTVDESGAVVDGVAGVDSGFGPFAPPATSTFEGTDALMLTRAEDRAAVRERWRSHGDRADRIDSVVRVRGTSGTRHPDAPYSPIPWSLARRERPQAWLAAVTVVLAAAISVAIVLGASPLWWLAVVVLLYLTGLLRGRSVLLGLARHRPGVAHVAHAVADGLKAAGLAPVGADHVRSSVAADGSESFHLADVDEASSTLFATSVEEALAPMSGPRYVVRREVTSAPRGLDWVGRAYPALIGRAADGEVWHTVPSGLARTRDRADAFATAWAHWVGSGPVLYAGSPEGAGVVAAQRGTDPLDVTCVIRRVWS